MYMDVPVHGQPIEGEFAAFGQLEAIEAAIVRAVVRGEEPVAALKRTSLRLGSPRPFVPMALFAAVGLGDLAQGLLNLRNRPDALADWAGFILMTSELFGLDDRHSDACDRLFTAIWNLSFGLAADAAMIRLAQSIARA